MISKLCMGEERKKKPSKLKIQKQSEENMIKSKKFFQTRKENEDKIIRYIRILFEQEDDYNKPIKVGNFLE